MPERRKKKETADREESQLGTKAEKRSGGGPVSKSMRLPMPRAKADELALRNHIALASMREGKGSSYAAHTLLEAVMVTGFLVESGHGQLDPARALDAEKAACDAIDRGKKSDQWFLELADVEKLAEIVTLYDQQFRDAPLSAVADASDRLVRFKAGLPFGLARKRRF